MTHLLFYDMTIPPCHCRPLPHAPGGQQGVSRPGLLAEPGGLLRHLESLLIGYIDSYIDRLKGCQAGPGGLLRHMESAS